MGSHVDAVIKTFWDICRLRAVPKDVPASRELFLFTLGLNLFLDLGYVLTEADLRHALSTHWLTAGLLAIGYFILSTRVLAALMPAHAGVH